MNVHAHRHPRALGKIPRGTRIHQGCFPNSTLPADQYFQYLLLAVGLDVTTFIKRVHLESISYWKDVYKHLPVENLHS